MKQMKLGLSLLTIGLVAGATWAASANAALPEIGRCVKAAPKTEGRKKVFDGKYSSGKCTTEAKNGKGKHEWVPEPGEKKEYESPGSSETATLETPKGIKVACKNHKVYGEYTGPKTETQTLGLYECELASEKVPCESVNFNETPPAYTDGTIYAEALEGELGLVNGGSKPVAGWAIKPKSGSDVAIFECGATVGLGTKFIIEGSYITTVKKVDRPKEEWFDYNTGAGGKQVPEKFEGATEAHTLKATILKGVEKIEEPIGYSTGEEELFNEEKLEIKAIV
jgi:hypothetical protein